MVLKKLVSFIYNLIGSDVWQKVKEECSSMSPLDEVQFEGELCCVCLSRLKKGQQETRILPCLHEFHKICVDRWFNACRKTCPVCRFSMGGEEKYCHTQEVLTDEMVIWFSSFHVAGF
jgi:hypothetical protein